MPRKAPRATPAPAVPTAPAGVAGSIARPSLVLPPDFEGLAAVDTESNGLFADDGARVSTVSVAFRLDGELHAYAFPFDQGMRDKVPSVQIDLFEMDDPNLDRDEWDHLLRWLDRPGMFHIYHNAKHDLEKLRVGTRHWPGRELLPRFWWDTAVANRELWPTKPIALKDTYVRETVGTATKDDQAAMKAWLKKNKLKLADMDKVPWSTMEPYATTDAVMTIELYELQSALYDEGIGDYNRLMRKLELTRTLYKMEARGLGYDAAGSLGAAQDLEARRDAIRLPFPATSHGAKRYFFEELSLRSKYAKKTKTEEAKGDAGKADSLDDQVTWAMARDGVPHAADWAAWSKIDRAVSMWYRGYPEKIGPDGRLRTSYRQTKVVSGRMSVERAQLQAIPKGNKTIEGAPGVRSFVRPREGHKLWNLDLSQAELRVASKYSGCKLMLELLESGEDIHSKTTREVMKVEGNKGEPEFDVARDIGKRLTFSGLFQVGPKTFRDTLAKEAHIDIPDHESARVVYGWRGLYPEFTRAYKKFEAQAIRNGWVTLLPGTEFATRSYFGPLDWPNTAWNRVVQGSLAEFVAMWLVETERITNPTGAVDGPLVLSVHDSVVLELPDDEHAAGVVARVAQWAEAEATRLFGIQMIVDTGSWYK